MTLTSSSSPPATIPRGTRLVSPGVELVTTRPWPTWWQRLWWWLRRRPWPKNPVIPVREVDAFGGFSMGLSGRILERDEDGTITRLEVDSVSILPARDNARRS